MKALFIFGSVALVIVLSSVISLAVPPPPPNQQVSTPTDYYQNEEQTCVCPTDSNIVIAVWRDFRLGYRQIGVGRSTDGGNTWTDSLISTDFQLFDWQSDPAMTVDADGNFYICYLDFDSSAAMAGYYDSSYITVIKSTDKGISWSGPITVIDTIGPYFEDKDFITTDMTGGTYHGNIYVAWMRTYGTPPTEQRTMIARSSDGGSSFDTTSVYTLAFVQPLVGRDGTVYIFGMYIYMSKSTDGGVSFTPPEQITAEYSGDFGLIDGDVFVNCGPTSAADIGNGPFGGNIYVAFAAEDYVNNDFNIEFIRSIDNGQTWSNNITINDDIIGPGAIYDQFHPWLVCNKEGVLAVVFYDQRTDPVNHTKFDLFAAYSYDGGKTFTINHRISDVSIDPALFPAKGAAPVLPGKDNGYFPISTAARGNSGLSEYIGCTIFKDHVNAVWTDTREGMPTVYGANWELPILEPRLISPLNSDTTLIFPHFKWATSWKNDDDQYRVEVAEDLLFSSILISEISDSSGLFSTVTPLATETQYYWRVKTFKFSTGDSSDYSVVDSFYVGPCVDSDGDGFGDPGHPENFCPDDNCPTVFNPDQTDSDGDGVGDACEYVCGDANGDEIVNIFDITFIIAYLYMDGPAPDPLEAGDANGDGTINIFDVTYLIAYLYMEGPEPICPE